MTIGRLGLLQLLTLLMLVAVTAGLVFLYRHSGFSYFQSLGTFIYSLNIAAPPLIVAALGFFLLLLTGREDVNVHNIFVRFIRNRFLQNTKAMLTFNLAALAVLLAVGIYLHSTPAVEYENLVTKILGSEADDFRLARVKIDEIERINAQRAENFRHVLDVFETRADINTHQAGFSNELLNRHIRSLETNFEVDPGWEAHPLRWHALAEAYSLYAQFLDGAASASGPFSPASMRKKSLELYTRVVEDASNRVTKLLRASAMLNTGNLYFYLGDAKSAGEWWQKSNQPEYGGPNGASWGNYIAALVAQQRYHEAVDEANRAEQWIIDENKVYQESNHYSGIVGNRGFSYLALGEFERAETDFQNAYNALPDNMSKINLALARSLNGRHSASDELLRKFLEPLTAENQAQKSLQDIDARCGYSIWFLASPGQPRENALAYLYTSIGESYSSQEIVQKVDSFDGEVARVIQRMKDSNGPCAYIFQLKSIENRYLEVMKHYPESGG